MKEGTGTNGGIGEKAGGYTTCTKRGGGGDLNAFDCYRVQLTHFQRRGDVTNSGWIVTRKRGR